MNYLIQNARQHVKQRKNCGHNPGHADAISYDENRCNAIAEEFTHRKTWIYLRDVDDELKTWRNLPKESRIAIVDRVRTLTGASWCRNKKLSCINPQ